jgi:glyoxylase-like metal-dependent hydrolase (beta-lactamase superfamily II)
MTKLMRVSNVALAAGSLVFVAGLQMQLQGQGKQDFSKVQIKSNKHSDNFYTLDGQGGTIGVLTGSDGVFMVDTQFAPLTDKIVAAIKQITPQPIRFAINTHLHGDHSGGNENLQKMGVFVMTRDQLREGLAHPPNQANGQPGAPAPAGALPKMTYGGAMTLHMNGERVELIPIVAAHTSGDTLVRFVNNDILMTGDYYRSTGYPFVDRANGGSLRGIVEGLGRTIGMAGPKTRIVPGHGPIVDRMAVMAHRDILLAVRDKVAPMVRQGMTLEQVVAAKPTAEFDSKVDGAAGSSERFIGWLYAELKANM